MMNKLLMLPWLLLNFLLLASTAVTAVVLIIQFPGGLALTCVALIAINGILFILFPICKIIIINYSIIGLILYFFQVVYSLYVDIEYEERLANLSSVKNKN